MVGFPASLDSLSNPGSTNTLDNPSHSGQHANANDILEALEAKVGVDSSTVVTSIDYKLANSVVLKSLFDANTILAANSDNTPAAVTVAEARIVGRSTGGNIAALTAAQVRVLADVPSNSEAILDALIDAKGDLIAGTASDTPARVAVGSDYDVLMARSTATAGVAWVNPSFAPQDITTSTAAAYTLALTDAGKIVEKNRASTNTVSIPSSSAVNFPTGTRVDVVQYGAGATTIVAATTGVSIRHTTSVGLQLASRYAGATVYKRAANEWVAFGDLKSS